MSQVSPAKYVTTTRSVVDRGLKVDRKAGHGRREGGRKRS